MRSDWHLLAFTLHRGYYTSPYPTHPEALLMRTYVLIAPALFVLAAPALADGPGYWPQWRGPSGQGYATDEKVPLEWSATKNLLWKTKLSGFGHSTPII